MPQLTAQALFDYADKYARKKESQDLGTEYPTVRQAARRFRVRQEEIEAVSHDHVENGYLGLIVGFQVGNGVGSIERLGDQMVEAYKENEV